VLTRLLRRRTAASVGLAVAVVGIAACGGGGGSDTGSGSGGAQSASFNLNIGQVIPLSGDLAPYGPAGQKAGKIAVEQINKALSAAGASGVKVKITSADEQTDPQAAVSAARKLVSDGSTCLVGAYASADTIPINQSVAARQGIPQISQASTSAQISDLSDNGTLFRVAPSDHLQGPALARYVDKSVGGVRGKQVTLAARNDAYGTGFIDDVKKEMVKLGAKVNGPIVYDPNAANYNSEASKIASGNPAAYVIIDFPQTYAKVGPALLRTGKFDPKKLFVADGLASSEGEPPPEGVSPASLNGARGTTPSSPKGGAATAAFAKLYMGSGLSPKARAPYDAQNFDATVLCALAAVAAGSNDPSAIKDKLRAVSAPPGTAYNLTQLTQAIKDLRAGKDINYEGISGPIDFAANGDPTSGTYDQYAYVGPKETYKTVGQFQIKASGT
jgi:ABC-type branched-subunit amino acid transport system substrate-binding protein